MSSTEFELLGTIAAEHNLTITHETFHDRQIVKITFLPADRKDVTITRPKDGAYDADQVKAIFREVEENIGETRLVVRKDQAHPADAPDSWGPGGRLDEDESKPADVIKTVNGLGKLADKSVIVAVDAPERIWLVEAIDGLGNYYLPAGSQQHRGPGNVLNEAQQGVIVLREGAGQ